MKKEFIKRKVKKIKLEIEDLLGMLSVEELTTNWKFIKRYQQLHQDYIHI